MFKLRNYFQAGKRCKCPNAVPIHFMRIDGITYRIKYKDNPTQFDEIDIWYNTTMHPKLHLKEVLEQYDWERID